MTSPSSGPGRAAPSCADCGTPAEPGQSFCDSCGAVLGWAGHGRPGRTEPTPHSEPTAHTAATGAPARTTTAPGTDDRTNMAGRTDTAHDTAHEPARSDENHPDDSGDRARPSIPAPRTAPADSAPHSTAPSAAPATSHTGAPGTTAPPTPYGHATGHHDGNDGNDGHHAGPDRTTPANPANPAAPASHRPAGPHTTAPDDDTEPLPHVTDSPEPPPQHHHRHQDDTAASAAAAERARSLLVPVADPEPRSPDEPAVAPVLPGRPVAHRPQVRAVGPQSDAEGGIPCPWCSTLNRPERHYCSRCAMSMTRGEDTPGRPPWWRRMFGGRNGESAWAGERPRLRRGFGHIWNWVVAAVVIGLVITLVVNLGAMIQATRDHFAKRAPIGPSSVKASRSFSGHGAPLAFDKLNNTWWGPGISQAAEGEWVEATFDQPTRLLDLVITPGTSTKPDQLSASALPRQLDAQITLADGEKITRTITLDQGAGGQRRKFRVGEVTTVRFVLRSAYGADPKKQVAIAEIEFFGPSSNNS
ncbi:zinc ribbon domain-containing protein [Streptomyces sp. CHD11]|uniref:NADase-type glycan-binding domain-containing protein n=1 Tax=Streptomyces sp. CHD11 TaxID=2741325 RepID=UPI001BFCA57A|nr:zinc ribbon domain-containing protein [Streptomyces sp. CHD11]MBT3152625.1 zinc ribbon domain-containing protein [Streptomyces sp. CHD11]